MADIITFAKKEADSTKAPNMYRLKPEDITLLIAFGIFVVGTTLRLAAFATNRSLFIDEAMLALSIVHLDWLDLRGPLAYNQVAPFGFLLVEKATIRLLSNTELSLRLMPLVAGIAALPLSYFVGRRCLQPPGALLTLFLLAVSEYPVYYSSEVKQYSTDLAIALLLLHLATPHLCGHSAKRSGVLGAFGAVALWFSLPAVFVLGGIGLALTLSALADRTRKDLASLAVLFGLWGVSLVAAYFASLSRLATDNVMVDYWRAYFMPMPPWSNWRWFGGAAANLLRDPVGLTAPRWIVGSMVVAGAISLVVRRWRWAVAICAPLFLAMIASGLRKYPFGQRAMLFAVPFFLVLAVAGLEEVRRSLRHAPLLANGVWIGLALSLAWGPVATAISRVQQPATPEHVRPLLVELAASWKTGDSAYVYYGARPAVEYYAPRLGLDSGAFLFGGKHRTEPSRYASEVATLAGRGRVWVVFSHNYDWGPVDERKVLLSDLDRLGRRQFDRWGSGASIHLYDLSNRGPLAPF